MSNRTRRQYLTTAGALALALALMLALIVLWGRPLSADDDGGGHVTNQIVVKLDPSARATIDQINRSYGTRTMETLLGSAGIYLLQLPPGTDDEKGAASKLSKDSRLVYAEPNYLVEAPEGDARIMARARMMARADGSAPEEVTDQRALDALNLPCAHGIDRGAGALIAVLDTGAQLDHPALSANFAGVPRYDFVDDDPDPSDVQVGLDADGDGYADGLAGHGTHVAGILDLVAPEAKIMPLRVLDSEGYGNVFQIAEALHYAERNGADVINLSLSSPHGSRLLQDAISNAVGQGVVIVSAAGNDNSSTEQYPAADNTSLAVASVDVADKKSAFTSFGSWIDVSAPGEEIYSTFPPSGYASWSGTSMATPLVAGQAALIRSENSRLSTKTVGDLITGTADPLDALNPMYKNELGHGRTDVGASFAKLRPSAACGTYSAPSDK